MFLVNPRYRCHLRITCLMGRCRICVNLSPNRPQTKWKNAPMTSFSTNPHSPISPNVWSKPRAAPAPTPPMRWRCAGCRYRSKCATARSRRSRALRRRRRGLARVRRAAAGGGLHQRHQGRRRGARRARGRHGQGRARGPLRRPRRCRRCWRAMFPTSICSIPICRRSRVLEARAKSAEAAGLAVKGVSKSEGASASAGIGGMVLVTSHGFRGAYLHVDARASSMSAIAGEGTAMERDYDYSSALHAADLDDPPSGSGAPPASARSSGSIRARSRPRRCRSCSTGGSRAALVGHLASAINGAAVARKTSFLRDKLRRAAVRAAASASSTIRCASAGCARVRSTARASPARPLALVDDGVLKTWLLDCATARELGLATTGHAARGVSSARRRPARPISISSRAR